MQIFCYSQFKNGRIANVFITGVLPITLDDLASGFNIADFLTLDPDFNGLITIANNGKYMEILKRYYGKSRIPNEVLAIFHEYQK
jgi:hypothetical protein